MRCSFGPFCCSPQGARLLLTIQRFERMSFVRIARGKRLKRHLSQWVSALTSLFRSAIFRFTRFVFQFNIERNGVKILMRDSSCYLSLAGLHQMQGSGFPPLNWLGKSRGTLSFKIACPQENPAYCRGSLTKFRNVVFL